MKTIALILFGFFLLSGCSAKNILSPKAKYVRIYDTLPANLNCKYKDEIIGSEANMITFFFMSNHDMTAGARASLRNQAVKLGGNSVEIQSADFMYQTSTTFIGQVYDCQPK